MAGNTAAHHPTDGGRSPVRRGPIDMLHLAKQAMGDPGLELEVLRVFDETARVNFERLERSTNVADLLVHLNTLKLAAAGVGAWSLVEHSKALETELQAGLPVNPERVDDIEMAIEELHTFIAERLALEEPGIH